MQRKQIDLTQSVYALCTQHPALIEVLKMTGFQDITKPGMLGSAGRFMTIPKGAALKKMDMSTIKQQLTKKGFSIKEQEE